MRKTIIQLLLSEDSNKVLQKFLSDNKITNVKDDLHTTLLYSETIPIFRRGEGEKLVKEYLPLEINPPYNLEIFGENSLALIFNSREFKTLKKRLYGVGVKQIIHWPDLDRREIEILKGYSFQRNGKIYGERPHITLVSPFLFNGKKFDFMNFPLVFDKFYWEN